MMKKEKNNNFIYIIQIFTIILISYICGFVYTNYDVIQGKNIGTFNLNNVIVEKSEDKTFLTFNNDKYIFIKKLDLSYKIKNTVNYKLDYNYKNLYGKENDDNREGILNSKLNLYAEIINRSINYFRIQIDSTDVEINNIYVINQIDYFPLTSIVTIILGLSIFFIFKYKKYLINHIEYLFLIIGLSSGLLFIIVRPIDFGQTWDEQIHFANVYGIFNDYNTVATKDAFDNYFAFNNFKTKEQQKELNEYLNNADNIITHYRSKNNFSYSKISYLPQAISYKICSFLKIPFTIKYIIGKIISLLIYLFIIFWAIKVSPVCKYLILTIGLIPTELLLACNYSYDPPIVAFSLLGFSFFLKELKSDKKIDYKNILMIIISFIFGSFSKLIYIFFMLILLTLKKDKFNNKKEKLLFSLAIIISVIVIFAPIALSLDSSSGLMGGDLRGGDTDVYKQIEVIKASPISFVRIFTTNIYQNFLTRFISAGTMTSLSYLSDGDSNTFYILIFALLLSLIIDKEKINISIKTKVILGIIILLIMSLICGSLYLAFTPVRLESINGVQGRYFIPLIMPLLLLIYNSNIKCEIKPSKIFAIYVIMLLYIEYVQIFSIIPY